MVLLYLWESVPFRGYTLLNQVRRLRPRRKREKMSQLILTCVHYLCIMGIAGLDQAAEGM